MDAMLKRSEVEAATGLSRSTIYRLMRLGQFPEPIRVGARAVRWPFSEVKKFLSERPRSTGDGD